MSKSFEVNTVNNLYYFINIELLN